MNFLFRRKISKKNMAISLRSEREIEQINKGKKTREIKYVLPKIFRETAFLAVFKFFPSSKIHFWPFLKLQKMEFGQKKFS